MSRVRSGRVAGSVLLGLFAASAWGQGTGDAPRVTATRIDRAPVIDGRVDEPEWTRAGVIRDLVQIRPGDGAPVSERTEVYLMYDKDALYIAAKMWDPGAPDGISARVMKHNATFNNDDRIAVIIDPFNTGRNGYRFEVNANGVRNDMLYQGGALQSDWSVIWESAASVGEGLWTVEFAIPFKSLPFDPAIENWGFNVSRAIRRRGEEAVWVSRSRSISPAIVGVAEGFKDLDPGVGLDVVPGVAVTRRKSYATGTAQTDTEPSIDLYYRVTPALTASLTVNTDFSATEVDDRQVNLTRFNLFFPEKRDFFLNDSDLFEFGRFGTFTTYPPGVRTVTLAGQQNGRPFFSRRIGLSALGTPVDIEYGGKISGRMGRYTVGAMGIRQGEFVPPGGATLDPSTLFVGRATMDVLAQSSVGVIATSGNPQGTLDNSLVGADFLYRNNRLPWGKPVEGDLWYQQSETENVSGDDRAFGVGFRIPDTKGWRTAYVYRQIGDNFFPALGFVNRTGIRENFLGVSHLWRPAGLIQSFNTDVEIDQIRSLATGERLTETVAVRAFEMETRTRDVFRTFVLRSSERLVAPFTIYDSGGRQVVIPVGDYRFDEYGFDLETGAQRAYAAKFNFRTGHFYDGDRLNLGGEFGWKPSPHFNLNIAYDWNRIELPYGEFTTRLTRFTAEVAFTPSLTWINLLQYDDVSEVFGLHSRLQWVPKAGQRFFLVLNRNFQDFDKDNSFSPITTEMTAKAAYTFRF
ncbi:MAG: DUF5916 domain-containing protein [Steroidobacteraceae bacterium]